MRYRINIVTYKNGRVTYTPQLHNGWRWVGLNFEGKADGWCVPMKLRDSALSAIDLNFLGNNTKQKIEFEYINKP